MKTFVLFLKPPYILSAIEKQDIFHTRDFYYTALNLQLTSTAGNDIIRCTLDGTKPVQYNEVIYSRPIPISVNDIMGKIVRTLVNRNQDAGQYSIFWDAMNNQNYLVSSGVYIYSLNTNNYYQKKKCC